MIDLNSDHHVLYHFYLGKHSPINREYITNSFVCQRNRLMSTKALSPSMRHECNFFFTSKHCTSWMKVGPHAIVRVQNWYQKPSTTAFQCTLPIARGSSFILAHYKKIFSVSQRVFQLGFVLQHLYKIHQNMPDKLFVKKTLYKCVCKIPTYVSIIYTMGSKTFWCQIIL